MKVYRLEYAGEYIGTYATDTLAKLKIADDMINELYLVESPEITEIYVVTGDEAADVEVADELQQRTDLGYIVDNGDDIWYRQTTGTYRIHFADGGWGNRMKCYTPDEIRAAYGIKAEVPA